LEPGAEGNVGNFEVLLLRLRQTFNEAIWQVNFG
jgi:hypothetical protein